ncbi:MULTISPECIES: hypothetical protein [Sorangium]|nr:hypothetical protein [Sorangium cellulosum]
MTPGNPFFAIQFLLSLHEERLIQLGRLLLSRSPEQGIAERAFDVANQLNHGAHLLTDPREKEALCRLNLLAGTKAKASVARGRSSA